jgi:hypothetical protein
MLKELSEWITESPILASPQRARGYRPIPSRDRQRAVVRPMFPAGHDGRIAVRSATARKIKIFLTESVKLALWSGTPAEPIDPCALSSQKSNVF